jgi:hypothetical protein
MTSRREVFPSSNIFPPERNTECLWVFLGVRVPITNTAFGKVLCRGLESFPNYVQLDDAIALEVCLQCREPHDTENVFLAPIDNLSSNTENGGRYLNALPETVAKSADFLFALPWD